MGTYDLEYWSGSSHNLLTGLTPGQPIRLDVDGDNVKDITAEASYLFVNFNLSGGSRTIHTPHISVRRDSEAIGKGIAPPPLRIEFGFQLKESSLFPSTSVRFGYDTGRFGKDIGNGSTIPASFTAGIAGIEELFNPLVVTVDSGPSTTGTPAYEGPLTLVGAIKQGSQESILDMEYRPLPRTLQLTYETVGDVQKIHYEQATGTVVPAKREVDIIASATVIDTQNDKRTELRGAIDRVPHTLDIAVTTTVTPTVVTDTATGQTSIVTSTSGEWLVAGTRGPFDGKRSDAVFDVTKTALSSGKLEQSVHAAIESLPDRFRGSWNLPYTGLSKSTFEALADPNNPTAGVYVGSVEAEIKNYSGQPTRFTAFVPSQRQYFSLQSNTKSNSVAEQLITARAEKVVGFSVSETVEGLQTKANVGDGALPLELFVSTDERAVGEKAVDVSATVLPMPKDVSLYFEAKDKTKPVRVVYDADVPVDVVAEVMVREPASSPSARCLDSHTACISLRALHVPTHAELLFHDTPTKTMLTVDSNPRTDGPSPELHAKVAAQGVNDPTATVSADFSLTRLPGHVFLSALKDDAGDVKDVHVRACKWQESSSSCASQTEGEIGEVRFRVANFFLRPAGFPEIFPRDGNYAVINAAGTPSSTGTVYFEAAGRMTKIEEARYVNNKAQSVIGFLGRMGGGEDFSATLNSQNLFDTEEKMRVSTTADLLIQPLPRSLELCIRKGGGAVTATATPAAPFTQKCELAAPFGTSTVVAPTSFHYKGSTRFSVQGSLNLVRGGSPSDPNDDDTTRANLGISNLPGELTTHILIPREVGSVTDPLRILYDAPWTSGPPPTSTFSAESLKGDAVCADPRPSKESLCAKGSLADLPSNIQVYFDPNKPGTTPCNAVTNLCISATYPSGVPVSKNLSDLELSAVKPVSNGKREILVLRGSITGLPDTVTGRLIMPKDSSDEPSFDIAASPKVGKIDVAVRNFIGADPRAGSPPARTSRGVSVTSPDIIIIQRGEVAIATATVTDMKRVGYRPVRSANGRALDTKVVNVDFSSSTNRTMRAYIDLHGEDPVTGRSTGEILADVILQNVPSGTSLCIRGKKNTTLPAPAASDATFCDSSVNQNDGVFQFVGDPGLNIDAYFRQSKSGTDILSSRVLIDEIPKIVRGRFPSGGTGGDIDIGGFDLAAPTSTVIDNIATKDLKPSGIRNIEAEIASFDITQTGYAAPPFEKYKTNTSEPFPTSGPLNPLNQFLSLALTDDEFHVRGKIGEVDSKFQRFRMIQTGDHANCPTVTAPQYPYFPTGTAIDYTCIRVDFDQSPNAQPKPLELSFTSEKRSIPRIAVHDAMLTKIPKWFQLDLSRADVFDTSGAFRPTCGTTASANCIPPLVRFDQDGGDVLQGMIKFGEPGDLLKLSLSEAARKLMQSVNIFSRDTLVDLDERPTAADWDEWNKDANGNPQDPRGIRAKIGIFNSSGGGSPRAAMAAGFRLKVPASFMLDHIRSWSRTQGNPDDAFSTSDAWKASNIGIKYALRDSNGTAPTNVGELAALINTPENDQILVSRSANDGIRGMTVPGELEANIYLRNLVSFNSATKQDFIQIDGRTNVPINGGARILPGRGSIEFPIKLTVKNLPAYKTTDPITTPGFRVQVELMGRHEFNPLKNVIPIFTDGCGNPCVKIGLVEASIDFQPSTTQAPARLLKAVVRTTPDQSGFEIESFEDLAATTSAPINVQGEFQLKTLDFDYDGSHWLNVAILDDRNTEVHLRSRLVAKLNLEKNTNFALRQGIIHVSVDNQGGFATIQPELHVTRLEGFKCIGQIGICEVGAGFHLADPHLGPVKPWYRSCEGGGKITRDSTLLIPGGDYRNIIPWPFDGADHRIKLTLDGIGFIDPVDWWIVSNRIRKGFWEGMCGPDATSLELIHKGLNGLGGARARGLHPGDPLTDPNRVPPQQKVPGASAVPPPPAPASGTPPTLPSKTLAAGQTLKLCGTHNFKSLTVPATARIEVATATSTVDSTGTGPDCSEDGLGHLNLVAEDDIVVSGTVTADGISPTTTAVPGTSGATGNSGAGHGGRGGNGSTGFGGPPYAEDSDFPLPASGTRGAGNPAGKGFGGGELVLSADSIKISGKVTADGADGDPAGVTPACGIAAAGGGGGSGGSLWLTGSTINVSIGATVTALGGKGGDGASGGGGGGGGVVRIISPIFNGSSPSAAGGGAGKNVCNNQMASPGGAGQIYVDNNPQSRVRERESFWHTGRNFYSPFSAGIGANPEGSQVVLCGISISNIVDGKPYRDQFTMPSGGGKASEPCGVETSSLGSTTPLDPIGSANVAKGKSQVPFDPVRGVSTTVSADFNHRNLQLGYWGFWTVVLKATTPGDDCLTVDGDDHIPGQEDDADCIVERLPVRPDYVAGIDNAAPVVNVTSPAMNTLFNTTDVNLTLSAQDFFSGIGKDKVTQADAIYCRNEAGFQGQSNPYFVSCRQGTFPWQLTFWPGQKHVQVMAVDKAGNTGVGGVTVTVDADPPRASATVTPTSPLVNGYHRTTPTIKFHNFRDQTLGSGPATNPYTYRFDFGDVHFCSSTTCTIPSSQIDDLTPGDHVLYWAPVDKAGNGRIADFCDPSDPNQNERCIPIKIDTKAPEVALATVPFGPTPSGWFAEKPWVVVSAYDQVGGSGIASRKLVVGGSTQTYSAPVDLGAGTHGVCALAEDKAGNQSASFCRTLKVDPDKPEVTLTASASPNSSGWYTSPPGITLQAGDGAGSGINKDFDCDVSPARVAKSASHGICMSINRGPLEPYMGQFTITQSVTDVRAFTVDNAGHVSNIASRRILFDKQPPKSSVRLSPPDPAQNGWWRRQPVVALRSVDGDMSSGLGSLMFSIDGGGSYQGYARAFPLTINVFTQLGKPGFHQIFFKAQDQATNAEPAQSALVPVDRSPPTATAKAPSPDNWITGVGPAGGFSRLEFEVTETVSSNVSVVALVYTTTPINAGGLNIREGTVVARVTSIVPTSGGVCGTTSCPVTNGALKGFAQWDGKVFVNSTLGYIPAPPGSYYFRIVAVDDAGNRTTSGESTKPINVGTTGGQSPCVTCI